MKKFIFFMGLYLFMVAVHVNAQITTFSKKIDVDTINNDDNNAVSIIANDNGFFIPSMDLCQNNTCIDFIKTDLNGNVQWIKPIEGYSNFITGLGGFIKDTYDEHIFHLNACEALSDGYHCGVLTIDQDCEEASFIPYCTGAYGVKRNSFKHVADNSFTVGYSLGDPSYPATTDKIFKKISANGAVIDSFVLDYEYYGTVIALDTCPQGYFMLESVWETFVVGSPKYAVVRRTDTQGVPIWESQLNNTHSENTGFCLVSMPNGNVAVSWASPDTVINGDEDAYPYRKYVACLDGQNGEVLWRVFFEEEYKKEIRGLRIADNGDIIGVGGYIGERSGWLFRISPQGQLLWERTYDHLNATSFTWGGSTLYDLAEAPDGGIVATGNIVKLNASNTMEPDVWLLKVDANGCLTPNCTEMVVDIGVGVEPAAPPTNPTAPHGLLVPNIAVHQVDAYYTLTDHSHPATLSLYDLQGRLALQQPLNSYQNQQSVGISHLPDGFYLYQFTQHGQVISSGKLLKQAHY